ncbi:hypothetical protein MWMV17_MWMV17_00183 [Acinetobacter calcoaceticus]|uniref:Uncharacterized protein n=1 Tax=Acinetobacter calcoaceticus DSM 30006 = CIP 81.8 TaxID=981331 RepID=A0ABN0K4X6_ACICA|nr:hypothetical protein [Acinetobacter calcoaceticus]ENV98506.1 hypothetical protein F936_01589 [Acinetobacter calcoaceticus DSM 30006 = CIP 81.8]CAI3102447.1 hypothetical protein MWMV17_MWMV17_00183 [Acinetobacter calcoaceticus]SUU58816.1 putative signal peptide-containing protein [Acinetobacter calcoaceticus]
MKTFLVISLLGFELIGCASPTYNSQENYLNKPPIVPENKAFNSFKTPEHGIFTDQDIYNMPENSNMNIRYEVPF